MAGIEKEMDITVSFDLFDTCFVRACGAPNKIFALLARKVLGDAAEDTLLADFCLIRQNGEQAARAQTTREEVTLEEIYAYCDFSGLTHIPNDEIASLECKIEREQLIPVWSIRQKIEKYHRADKSILYISDTYLSEKFIRSLLEDNGFWQEGDKLYVSSKIFLAKSTGNLYKYIAQSNNIQYSCWHHHGDNRLSDVIIPQKLGIKATHTDHIYTCYEQKTRSLGLGINRHINEVLASVSKGVLLSLPEHNRYAVACDLIAPLYVPFVYGIMQDAAEKGIGRLFFSSRDGYILYQIALQLKKYCFQSLELSYLYISRCALYIAGCNTADDSDLENDLQEILKEGDDFCKRLAEFVPFEVYSAILEAMPELKQEHSSKTAVEHMMACEQASSLLKNHISQQKELLIQYFRQEGLANKTVKTAIIDLRGTRKCGKIINDILIKNQYPPSFGYYLEVMRNRCLTDKQNQYMAFLQVDGNLTSFSSYLEIAARVLEDYFSASPHKSTTHYGLEYDKVIPIFNESSFSLESEDVFSCNRTVMESFVKYYYLCALHKHNDYCFKLGIDLLANFFDDPDGYYLSALQHITGGFYHYHPESIVKKCSFTDIWKRHEGWEKGSFFLTLYLWRNRIKNLGSNVLAICHGRRD